ncbi:MAG: cupin domain-containing protein [Elusimicrobiales bacterium]|nr:cupin domain-containing protein [Elusimicrobiales bacterium]
MKNKHKVKHGNISSLTIRRLGDLEMRVVDAAGPLNLTFLHESLPPNGTAPYVIHSRTMEFVYVTKGEMTGIIDGRKIRLREGDYLFLPCGVEHRFEAAGAGVEAVSVFLPQMDMNKPDAKIVFSKKKSRRLSKV